MTGTLRVFRAEAYRLLCSRGLFVAGVFLFLLSALRVWAARLAELAAHAERVRRALAEDAPIPPAPPAGNAFGPLVDGWLAGMVAGAILLLIHAARTLAADRESGILRIAATRSASRPALVVGRALVAPLLVVGLLAASGLGALLVAALTFHFGPLVEDGYELLSASELRGELFRAVVATVPPLLATYAFGLLLSSALRSSAAALTVAVAGYLAFDVFKEALGDRQYAVFAAFNPSLVDGSCMREMAGIARGFSDAGYTDALYRTNLWLPWPQALVFLLLACWFTARRPL